MTYSTKRMDYARSLEMSDFSEIEDGVSSRRINYARQHSAKASRGNSRRRSTSSSKTQCGFSGRKNRKYHL